MRTTKAIVIALVSVLTACAEPEERLPGERLDVRTPVNVTPGAIAPLSVTAQTVPPARLAAPTQTNAWTHRGGTPARQLPHAAIDGALAPLWDAKIGAGERRDKRITATPVSDGARIFTLDAEATVAATSTNGQSVWSRDLTPPGEKSDESSGGGLAIAGTTLFVTTGFGELTALSAATGAVLWSQDLDAAPAGPPVVAGGLVYLVTRGNLAWAIDASNGRVRWQFAGIPATAGFGGGAGPAVNATIAVFPFSSGQIIAVLRRGGFRLWAGSVSGKRLGRVYANISDFGTDPVIAGGRVYAGTSSGRVAAFELNTGERMWTAQTGVSGSIAMSENSIWAVSDDARLVRLSRATGTILWDVELPYFRDKKLKRRKGIYAHHGPILAGGRLLVASSDRQLRAFNPQTGAALGALELASAAATAPIVVRGTVYLVTSDGHLRAFR